MRKLWLTMLGTLAFLGTATVSEANIFVTISDGPNTVTASKNLLKLTQAINSPILNADTTTTMNIITCPTAVLPPCTVFFPSGQATQQNGDTFKIQDVASNNRARIEVLDAATSSDRVSFKGVKFTSILAPPATSYVAKTLTITYGTQSGNLRALTSAQASSYFVSAAFSGSFKNSTGLSRASACKAGTASTDMDTADDACARLSVTLNGTGVDGQGNTVSATVAVACSNSFPTLNPCGTNGSWSATSGTFTGVNDGRSLSCPSTCSPVQVATLTGKFNGVNEVLQLTASLNGVIANVTDENGGVEDATLALAGEVGLNRWVTTSANNERCKAVPKAPATNDTRNITNNSSLPISFEYWCGQLSPSSTGIPLVSLADTLLLPGAASTRYSASRETFLPDPGSLSFKNIGTLILSYNVFTGTVATDSRLPPVNYTDCEDGSIRLEIQLVDSNGVDQGTAKVYLGKNPGTLFAFTNDCALVDQPFDIKGNSDARVDLSGLVGNLSSPCCVKFSDAQKGNVGNQLVRRIAFIVSRPVAPVSDPELTNYGVQFLDGNVNAFSAATPLPPGTPSSLQTVTNFVRKTDLSTNGVSITITKLTSPTGTPQQPNTGVVLVIPSSQIIINGGKYTTSVNVNQIQAESGASYAIALCPNGAETDVVPDPTNPPSIPVRGLCIADQGRMTLQ